MRKFLILSVLTTTAISAGCCGGRSPCSFRQRPQQCCVPAPVQTQCCDPCGGGAVMSAPMGTPMNVMSAPMMSAPMAVQSEGACCGQ